MSGVLWARGTHLRCELRCCALQYTFTFKLSSPAVLGPQHDMIGPSRIRRRFSEQILPPDLTALSSLNSKSGRTDSSRTPGVCPACILLLVRAESTTSAHLSKNSRWTWTRRQRTGGPWTFWIRSRRCWMQDWTGVPWTPFCSWSVQAATPRCAASHTPEAAHEPRGC